ncbi:MAG: glycosyltransferase [Clostridiales bacterium]|nr:glycosyltransferase [Clostridiales bacterium]
MNDEVAPKISIIINSFKNLSLLSSCLESIKDVCYRNKEVIVVSYGLSETKINELSNARFVNKLIIMKKDLGVSAQRNLGYKQVDVTSKYVLFVDDDVLLSKYTVKSLIEFLEYNKNVGIAQPVLLRNNKTIDCAGAFIDKFGYTRIYLKGEPFSSIVGTKKFINISYSASACLMMRREIFSNDPLFHPFDNELYFNYEDVDLSIRCWLKEYKVVCVFSAFAFHKRGRTKQLKKSPANLVYLNTRNKFIVLTSASTIKEFILNMSFFVGLETLKGIRLLNIDKVHSLSVFKAISWSILNFKQIWQRRAIIQKNSMKKSILNCITLPFNFQVLVCEFCFHYEL